MTDNVEQLSWFFDRAADEGMRIPNLHIIRNSDLHFSYIGEK